jgi:hypothetical protein
MKRTRSTDEIVHVLERMLTLEDLPKDILHLLLTKNRLSAYEINNVCRSSSKLRALCKNEELWEKIYMKYVNGANRAVWRACEPSARGPWSGPNHFLRFMSFYALHEEEGYTYRFESPSKEEALVLHDSGLIRPKFKMPSGYEEQWCKNWKSNDVDSDGNEIEDDDDNAYVAFNDQFGDDGGCVWEYVTYEQTEFGNDIQQLVTLGIIMPRPTNEMVLQPVHSMEHVYYSLMALGWRQQEYIDYPDINIKCKVCSNIATTMCQRCNAPICGNVCFIQGHKC